MLFLLICCVGFATIASAEIWLKTVETPDFRSVQAPNINKEYKLQFYVKANWYNAYLFCRNNGMQLATINSKDEQDHLKDLIASYGIKSSWWLAGADLGEEGRFSWYPTGDLFRYTNWASNQPDNTNHEENCLLMKEDNKWNDYKCNQAESFICEKDL